MDLINCAECGQVIVKVSKNQKSCNDCIVIENREFDILKQHLRNHGRERITIQELSRTTGVSISRIINWVKEGSIQST